jgi:hypothetical protein
MPKPEIRALPLSVLSIDPNVQRGLDQRRVAKIAAELNLDALGVITVSQRPDGGYFIIDGQHRTEGVRQAGHATHKMSCRVFTGLSLAEEAALFRLLNNTAKPQYIDLFRVRTVEGEPVAVDIDRMVSRHGWKIGQGNYSGVLSAVQAFERIYLMDEASAERTLITVTRAWGHDAAGVDGRILEGIGLVYVRYQDSVAADDLTDRLARFPGGAGALLGKARGWREMHGSTVPRALAELVVEEYNRRRRTKALPPWRAS